MGMAGIVCASFVEAQTYNKRAPFGFAAQAKEEEGQAFDECRDDAIAAFDVGRLYHLSRRSMRKSLLETSGPSRSKTAQEVMDEMDLKPAEHYATIAARRFASCAKTSGNSDPAQFKSEEICMARVEVPTSLISYREDGVSERQAAERTERTLNRPDVYPPKFILATAKLVYERKTPQDDWAVRRMLYLSCMQSIPQQPQ